MSGESQVKLFPSISIFILTRLCVWETFPTRFIGQTTDSTSSNAKGGERFENEESNSIDSNRFNRLVNVFGSRCKRKSYAKYLCLRHYSAFS
jgi:hypothetical protein